MSIYDGFSEADIQRLKARAQRIAKTSRVEETDSWITALCARLGAENYALPVESILAVYENVQLTPLPCVPDFVAGLVNLRGHLFPVLDLRVLLGVSPNADQHANTIVVVFSQEVEVALLVEQASEVKAIPINTVLPLPAALEVTNAAYFQGVLNDGTILLNLDTVLSDPALIVNQAML